jgi:DNA (cytosine-5)-methyltransferase 1
VADKPRLLDLFCGAGGAAMGYAQAGFEVIGIDSAPQPNYPFEFHQDDALEFLESPEWPVQFHVIHASPPCQRYAHVTRWRGNPNDHPDLLDRTVDALALRPIPWIVENVPEAMPNPDLLLCGSMFGLSIRRHRHFMSSVRLAAPGSCRHGDLFPFLHKGERSYADAMECAWMSSREAREGIPPAYSRWIGSLVLEALGREGASTKRWALCQQCGRAFAHRRSAARYCSNACRQRRYDQARSLTARTSKRKKREGFADVLSRGKP